MKLLNPCLMRVQWREGNGLTKPTELRAIRRAVRTPLDGRITKASHSAVELETARC
jgi:hypothetical protein